MKVSLCIVASGDIAGSWCDVVASALWKTRKTFILGAKISSFVDVLGPLCLD